MATQKTPQQINHISTQHEALYAPSLPSTQEKTIQSSFQDPVKTIKNLNKDIVAKFLERKTSAARSSTGRTNTQKASIFEKPLGSFKEDKKENFVSYTPGSSVPKDYQLFYFACLSGLSKTVKRLMKKGLEFPLNSKGFSGYTPLHATLLSESKENHRDRLLTAEVLLEADPKIVDIPTIKGLTAMHIASQLGDCSFIKLLIKFGANIEYSTPYNKYTPLALAIHGGQYKAALLLVQNGANIQGIPNADFICRNLKTDPKNTYLQTLSKHLSAYSDSNNNKESNLSCSYSL